MGGDLLKRFDLGPQPVKLTCKYCILDDQLLDLGSDDGQLHRGFLLDISLTEKMPGQQDRYLCLAASHPGINRCLACVTDTAHVNRGKAE